MVGVYLKCLIAALSVIVLGCSSSSVRSIDVRGMDELLWREIAYPAYSFTSESTMVKGSNLDDGLLDARIDRADFEPATGSIRLRGQVCERGTENGLGPSRLILSRLQIRDSIIICTHRRSFETSSRGWFDITGVLDREDYLIVSSFTYRPIFYRIGLLRNMRF